MSFRDPERNNTFNYQARLVWEIKYHIRMPVAHSVYGTGEVERIPGAFHEEDRVFHVLAETEAEARLVWWKRFSYDGANKIITCEAILAIDAEITIRSK